MKALARERHTISRRLERREKWLERSGVSIETFRRAVQKLVDLLDAKKTVPSVVDKRGTVLERVEVDDTHVQEKAAKDLAALHIDLMGLSAPKEADTQPAQIALVVNLPDWIVRTQPAQLEADTPRGRERLDGAAPVAVAEITDEEVSSS